MTSPQLSATDLLGAMKATPLSDLREAADALREELDAMVGYRERAAMCKDPELQELLNHHAREEAEHAAMLIEWLRRNEPAFAHHINTFVKRSSSIMELEENDDSEQGNSIELKLDTPTHMTLKEAQRA